MWSQTAARKTRSDLVRTSIYCIQKALLRLRTCVRTLSEGQGSRIVDSPCCYEEQVYNGISPPETLAFLLCSSVGRANRFCIVKGKLAVFLILVWHPLVFGRSAMGTSSSGRLVGVVVSGECCFETVFDANCAHRLTSVKSTTPCDSNQISLTSSSIGSRAQKMSL